MNHTNLTWGNNLHSWHWILKEIHNVENLEIIDEPNTHWLRQEFQWCYSNFLKYDHFKNQISIKLRAQDKRYMCEELSAQQMENVLSGMAMGIQYRDTLGYSRSGKLGSPLHFPWVKRAGSTNYFSKVFLEHIYTRIFTCGLLLSPYYNDMSGCDNVVTLWKKLLLSFFVYELYNLKKLFCRLNFPSIHVILFFLLHKYLWYLEHVHYHMTCGFCAFGSWYLWFNDLLA